MTTTNAYKIKYENGVNTVVLAKSSLDVIKKYDLATQENANTRIIQLEGEQKAIALDSHHRDITNCVI